MMNDISSAAAPHSARFSWNTDTQDTIIPVHTRTPSADHITSETKQHNKENLN